jgi:hypothetical protein
LFDKRLTSTIWLAGLVTLSKLDHMTLVQCRPKPLMLSVARRAKSKHAKDDSRSACGSARSTRREPGRSYTDHLRWSGECTDERVVSSCAGHCFFSSPLRGEGQGEGENRHLIPLAVAGLLTVPPAALKTSGQRFRRGPETHAEQNPHRHRSEQLSLMTLTHSEGDDNPRSKG